MVVVLQDQKNDVVVLAVSVYRARARAARAAAPKPVPTCALLAPAVTIAPVAEAVLVEEPAPEAPATPEGCEPAAEPV